MSYFFPSITPKWYAPNLTYIMKKHEKRAHKSAWGGGGPMSDLGDAAGKRKRYMYNNDNVVKH